MGSPNIGIWPTGPFTLGGWFRFTTLGTQHGLMGCWDTSNPSYDGRGYRLIRRTNNHVRFEVCTSAGAVHTVQTAEMMLDANKWYHIAGRFDPGADFAVFINGQKTTYGAAFPADINFLFYPYLFALDIGQSNGADFLAGSASLLWYCAYALPDVVIESLFWQTRYLFQVGEIEVEIT